MRRLRLLSLLVALALPAFAADLKPASRKPILVELFTSEGCSSCPPADALLARLAQEQPIPNAEIIVLGEHVDYWDGLGWRDRFSSPQYTTRQRDYSRRFFLDSVYTPQMVVDGSAQFVGNDAQLAREALQKAAKAAKLPLALSTPTRDGTRFSAIVSLPSPQIAKDQQGELYAALVDPMDTTEVRHGENGGRTLRHISVVRTLMRVGSTRDLGNGPLAFTLAAPTGADPSAMRIVVFAQRPDAGPILGVTLSTSGPVHSAL